MNFYINFHNKRILIPNVKKLSGFQKGIGLMFRRKENCSALLFEFKKPVKISFTSWFVFFPFLMIWFNETNEVINIKKISPFTFHIPSLKPCRKVLEVPFNSDYEEIIKKLFKRSSRENI